LGELLLTPLASQQVAPVGFLLVEKSLVATFGASELALRAFPLLCSIMGLILLCRVAHRLLPAESIPLVIAPSALAPPLIFFGTEAKQYSSDIAIALALWLIPSLLLLTAIVLTEIARALRSSSRSALATAAATLLVLALNARALRNALPVYRRDGAPARTSLYLYDLSDTTRLRSRDATHSPTSPRSALDARPRCAADIV
jgi:hypothetical protein